MSSAISYRGPDDSGLWSDERGVVHFSHRRLSILDLSPAGHQPMTGHSGRFTVTFNGEIYNYRELQQELRTIGVRLRGGSDTEVLLECVAAWGIEESLARFNGMFAFALWDSQERTLTLARDRIGKKPLYYGWGDNAFLFSSELKSFRAVPEFFSRKVSDNSVAAYLHSGYIPAPHSIYEGAYKLPPGTFFALREDELRKPPNGFSAEPSSKNCDGRRSPERYWSLRNAALAGAAKPILSELEATTELESLLLSAVSSRMVSDVPLGGFLSGGIDSSLVVALMQRSGGKRVQTFTVGFEERSFDESIHARKVAEHLGTDHHELILTSAEAQRTIPSLAGFYDEPFGDSSQLPTYLVSKFARTKVTVALSGDGGDELFGGYSRYVWVEKVWKRMALLPRPIRSIVGGIIRLFPVSLWDRVAGALLSLIPLHSSLNSPGEKLHKFADLLGIASSRDFYAKLSAHWHPHARDGSWPLKTGVVPSLGEPSPLGLDLLHTMTLFDMERYLPDDILVKVDRASMAVSLEARAPLLDYRVIELSWRVPSSLKLKDGGGKYLLRKLAYSMIPQELLDRPKMGFGVPIGAWLRGPLKEWAQDSLSESRLKREGYFDPGIVRRKLDEHLSGARSLEHYLWDILMFQGWLEEEARLQQNT